MNKCCKCKKCQIACKNKPGWFNPGEPKKVAKYLSISLKELFDTKLMVDWYGDIFIITPAIKHSDVGKEFPANPNGECIFFNNGLCEIHKVKPYECREYVCIEKNGLSNKRHKKVKNLWNKKRHQQQIKNLLGRTPISKSYSLLDKYMYLKRKEETKNS